MIKKHNVRSDKESNLDNETAWNPPSTNILLTSHAMPPFNLAT